MLELTRREAEELLKVLESYLSELRMEIAGTDSWDYRQGLKKRKVVLDETPPAGPGTGATAAARGSAGDQMSR